jgi:hypothetical protein
MIYAFVQRFLGRITLDTVPGKGTTFTLWFPAAQEEATDAIAVIATGQRISSYRASAAAIRFKIMARLPSMRSPSTRQHSGTARTRRGTA